jgi:hypothetical protein
VNFSASSKKAITSPRRAVSRGLKTRSRTKDFRDDMLVGVPKRGPEQRPPRSGLFRDDMDAGMSPRRAVGRGLKTRSRTSFDTSLRSMQAPLTPLKAGLRVPLFLFASLQKEVRQSERSRRLSHARITLRFLVSHKKPHFAFDFCGSCGTFRFVPP